LTPEELLVATQTEEGLSKLAKASRLASRVSVIGLLVVIGTIVYAFYQLHILERERSVLQEEQQQLKLQTTQYRRELQITRGELGKARQALASARAAINAYHAGDFKGAIALYDQALEMNPDDAYLQNLRAYSLFRAGRIAEALAGEERSVTIDPTYAWGYFDLARFLCASSPSRMQEARRAAEKAIDLRPDLRPIMRADGEFQKVCKHQLP
jgi:tetratricopeptide (TPR) repeat protein